MTTLFRPSTPLHFEPRGHRQSGQARPVARLHRMDCSCTACAQPAADSPDDLRVQTMAKLAILAAIVGSAIAFTIDPAGAVEALRATVAL